jgi:hypothetical protein
MGSYGVVGGNDEQTTANLAVAIQPAFQLGQDLLAEGHASVDKIVRRAAWHAQRKEFAEAASLLGLAARLVGVESGARDSSKLPDWFTSLAEAPLSTAEREAAEAAVSLAEAMAASETPSEPVQRIVEKARREADAGRMAEAAWWSSVALAALGAGDVSASAVDDSAPREVLDDEVAE